MYGTSAEFQKAILSQTRRFRTVVSVGGTTYSGTDVREVSLTESISAGDRILPGVASCANISVTVVGSQPVTIAGTIMSVTCGLLLPSGSYEDIPLGQFVVEDIQNIAGEKCIITGHDKMIWADSMPFADVLTEEELAGSMYPSEIIARAVAHIQTKHPDFQLFVTIDDEVLLPCKNLPLYTCREIFAMVAGATGRYAQITRASGNCGLVFYSLPRSPDCTIPRSAQYLNGLNRKVLGNIEWTPTVYATDEMDSGTGDYTNDLITASVVAHTRSKLPTMTYCPGTLKWRGNPALRAGDVASAETRDGSLCYLFVSTVTLHIAGGISSTITSDGASGLLTGDVFSAESNTRREMNRLKYKMGIISKEDVIS